MAAKPRVFIGSSVEGRGIAEHIQSGLESIAECVRWSQGVVGVSESTLESLLVVVRDFDFAIIVLTPGDLDPEPIKGRRSPRDNIVFELGLFVGALGRGHTFIVHGKDPAITQSMDFAGVTGVTFVLRGSGDREAAITQSCALIRSSIQMVFRPRSEPPTGSVTETMNKMSADLASGSTDLAKQTARLRRKIDSVMPGPPRRVESERPKKGHS